MYICICLCVCVCVCPQGKAWPSSLQWKATSASGAGRERRSSSLRTKWLELLRVPEASKALALIWYRALTWYSSPARPFVALDVPLLVTRQQGSPPPRACRQLSTA